MASNEVEAMRASQSKRILDHLENWIAAAPGRSLRIEQPTPGEWLVTLDEAHRPR
ncbi:MAG TPA: hypothetical protein VH062_09840 [Polyangiaceae bacterium]|jgi:hypothetical protein|nr:hypothetical protein [Polyangiaceae bacterium]